MPYRYPLDFQGVLDEIIYVTRTSQTAVARQLNVTQATLSRLQTNKGGLPKLQHAWRIIQLAQKTGINVTLEEVLTEEFKNHASKFN